MNLQGLTTQRAVLTLQRERWVFLLLCGFVSLVCWVGLSGCAYSFTGASVPPHLKSIAIPQLEDRSGFGDPTLRELFSRQLAQRFISDNTLQPAERNSADAVLEGVITAVNDAPLVIEGSQQVRKRRISITVHMTMQDVKLRKKMWEKDFSQWGDYTSGGGLTQRNGGLNEAIKKLSEDILNETVAGW
ncbi:MAG: LptE family protein [bacterium]